MSVPNPPASQDVRRTLFLGLIVWLVTLCVFRGCLENEFVNWDDGAMILNNPGNQSLGLSAIGNMFTSFDSACYVPLSRMSLALDYVIWGRNPFGTHLTNILFHALNAVLVFVVARVILQSAANGDATPSVGRDAAAVLAALIYALHPLRVESVAWAAERRDVLAGFFTLLSVWMYLRSWKISATIFFGAALLSKANAIALPVIFLLLDAYPLRRVEFGEWRANASKWLLLVREKWMMFAASLAVGVTAVVGQRGAGAMPGVGFLDLPTRLANAMLAHLHYLGTIVRPVDLNPLYVLDRLHSWHEVGVWLGFFLLVWPTAILLWTARRHPAPFAIWISYLLLIGPFLGLLQIGRALAADRYTYLAAIPLSLGIAAIAARAWGPARRSMWPGFAAAVLALGALGWMSRMTAQQVRVWRNSVNLWSHSVSLDPSNPLAWHLVGDAYLQAGKPREALGCAIIAVKTFPGHPDHLFDLGACCMALQRYPEAARAYEKALQYSPDFRDAMVNLGVAYTRVGRWKDALQKFEDAQRRAPTLGGSFQVAECHEHLGNEREAITGYQKAAEDGFLQARVAWSDLVARRDARRGLTILDPGLAHSTAPILRVAYVRRVLQLKDARPAEIERARQFLENLRQGTGGRSEIVTALAEEWDKRHPPSAPAAIGGNPPSLKLRRTSVQR